MIVVSGSDPLHDEAIKQHDENEKDYESAMKENKEAVDLVSGDNTKKKNEKTKKNKQLKKMHLSEALFEDWFEEDFWNPGKEFNNFMDIIDEDGMYDAWNSMNQDERDGLCDKVAMTYINRYGKPSQEFFDDLEDNNFHSEYRAFQRIMNESFDSDVSMIENIIYDNTDKSPREVAELIQNAMDGREVNESANSKSLTEDAGDAFLDRIAKKVVSTMSEDLNEEEELNEVFSEPPQSELNNDEKEWGSFIPDGEGEEEATVKLFNKVEETINKNFPKNTSVEVYNHETLGPSNYLQVDFLVNGDWKHEHLAFNYWMKNEAPELLDCDIKYGGEDTDIEEDNGSDSYSSVHTFFFIPKEESVQPKEEPEDLGTPEEDMGETEDIGDMEEIGNADLEPVDDDMLVAESLKFDIAKEQLKRFNEGKMPSNWSPRIYLENLAKRKHITREQKNILSEAFLK